MSKILWLSDGANLATGYSTISRKLLNCLVDKGHECHYLCHTMQSQTIMPGIKFEDGEELKFTLHGNGAQPYAFDIMSPKIKELKPDVFGILLDTFMLYPHFLNIDTSPAKTLFYFPSDGMRFPTGCENILRKVDVPISMSLFAQKQVKDLFNIESQYIPHAIEPDVYKPLSDQERAILKAKIGFPNRFIIGCVARNQGRKMLDRALPAFKLVADKMPNAILIFHCDKTDPASYFNFDDMINYYGLNNRVFFTGMRYFKGFDYRKMNELYNLFDIFFLPTSGEGFGIPTIEAMSCSIPVLVTDYTTTNELVTRNKSGEAVKLATEILGNWGVFRGVMDIQDAAEKLLKLYSNPLLRKEYGLNGRSAVLRDYDWRIVSEQWNTLIKNMSNK